MSRHARALLLFAFAALVPTTLFAQHTPVSGTVADRIGADVTLGVVLTVQVVAFLVFAVSRNLATVYPAAVAFGIGYGGTTTVFPAIVGQRFGRAHAGAIVGLLFAGAGSLARVGELSADLDRLDGLTPGDGPVLVPMLQRLLQLGARRMNQETMAACGELSALDRAKQWASVDGVAGKNILLHAGVYRAGERLLAVNRPSAEDDRALVTAETAKNLLGPLPLQLLQQPKQFVFFLQ